MIARVRGEHDRGRWRLHPANAVLPSLPLVEVAEEDDALGDELIGYPRTSEDHAAYRVAPWRRGWRWIRATAWALLALVVMSVAYVALDWVVDQFGQAPATTAPRLVLPVTPRAWLDAYEAAAIDNPGKVCSQLFSPALARAYGRAMHGSCVTYFDRISSSSLTVRHVFSDGPTAVLELRQTLNHADWVVVLSHRPEGWQAVDLLAGDLLR